ncbi:hypothetical protein PsYK624_048530 [Phanerochaete sordida]|uniref:Uncharacterized protein n=1 Tax=Phanerochaete sordida TaxID=48140 RepID=A0A9P3LC41_9APHY|nr:hypothetical protein PsYK624_048530 [Phanerochaete sordida]
MPTAVILSLFTFVVLLATALLAALGPQTLSGKVAPRETYTYRGRDYPRSWEIGPLPPVELVFESTVHYTIGNSRGALEWNSTLPSGGAVVHLGPEQRPFTVSLFHQLRCLNIIRTSIEAVYADELYDEQMSHHCMNYLRQMVLCRADTRLEPIRAIEGGGRTVSDVGHTCADWTVVYEAAEQNYREYARLTSS